MEASLRFLPPIPEGYRIWRGDLEVAGVRYRTTQALQFSRGKSQRIQFEPEPGNKHDPNAVKIIGSFYSWWMCWNRHIGYIDAEVAKEFVDRKDQHLLLPRLRNIWVGGYHEIVIFIRYDIMEPKKKRK